MIYVLGFFLILLISLVLLGLTIKDTDEGVISKEFLSFNHTSICRGLAIVLVVINHLGTGVYNSRVFTPLGGIGVALFLICSGYGLVYSFKRNGVNNFFKKRVVKVLMPYFYSIIMFNTIVIGGVFLITFHIFC